MKKGFTLTTLLAFVLVFNSFAEAQQTQWNVNNTATWIEALNGIRGGGNNRQHLVRVTGNVTVPPVTDVAEIPFCTVTSVTVTIEGNGSLALSGNGALLFIGSGQTVIIRDIALQGRSANDNPLVVVYEGTFRMEGNASVSGNNNPYTAGVVVVDGGGTFTMHGNASVSGNKGGGVSVSNGSTFTMHGNASVYGNTSVGTGGGVHIAMNSIFTMHDNSSVSENTSGMAGGVIIAGNSSFTMNGSASVSGNIAMPFYNEGFGTGGVEVIGGIFTMQGNTMVSGNTGFNGGGVRVGSRHGDIGGTFNMHGGVISGNTASQNGGGVLIESGTFNKTGGTLYGSNADNARRNTAARGHAAFHYATGIWRNATAGPTVNTGTFGFWLNE